MDNNQLLGISRAADHLGWQLPKFSYYVYKLNQPIPDEIIDTRRFWRKSTLDAWRKTLKRKNAKSLPTPKELTHERSNSQ